MVHPGDVIENPAIGQRVRFLRTAEETDGEAVVIEAFIEPHAAVATAHVHPCQEKRFEVLRGSVGFEIGGDELVARPGQRVTVPPGTSHRVWNAGDEAAHFVCEIRPALDFEESLAPLPVKGDAR